MTALIVRLPEDKRARLKALAKARGTSVNKLMEEMTTILITDFDAETRFRIRAARGDPARALKLLERVGAPDSIEHRPRTRSRRRPAK